MIKLYHEVSDVIQANEHKKHANCGLHVNFCTFLSNAIIFFMMKKDHFQQNLLLWPQDPFNKSDSVCQQ